MHQNDLELQLNFRFSPPTSTILYKYLLSPKLEKLCFLGRVVCLLTLQCRIQVSRFGVFMDLEVFLIKQGMQSCLELQASVRQQLPPRWEQCPGLQSLFCVSGAQGVCTAPEPPPLDEEQEFLGLTAVHKGRT